jgi:deazaflavin-dependent oxidoreductase (nitroreductase family)
MAEVVTFAQANALRRTARTLVATGPASRIGVHLFHRLDTPVFRLTRGRQTVSSLVTGLPVVLLHTRGARTGRWRATPVLGVPTSEGFIVIGSNFGQARDPSWSFNLRAHPEGELDAAGRRSRFRAIETFGEQRERLWRAGLELYPGWRNYARRATDREIPVFILEGIQSPPNSD